MHRCLNVDEVLRLLAHALVASQAKTTAVSLACCRKNFEGPVLDALWETQERLLPLLKTLPGDVWKVEAGRFVSSLTALIFSTLTPLIRESFNTVPTKAEQSRFRKYAGGMRKLEIDISQVLVNSEVLLALQFCAGSELLLPKLTTFICTNTTEDFIPFIPLFLSTRITNLRVKFINNPSPVTIAVTIAKFPMQYFHIKHLTLDPLPRSPAITAAVSEMLLACKRDTLHRFSVASPLTEDALKFLCKLPKLRFLRMIIEGPAHLPQVALPDLERATIKWHSGRDWLEGFRGATVGKLKSIFLYPMLESAPLDGFLEEFQDIALSTSIQSSLSEFKFYTSRPWSPNYSSLFEFNQMTNLVIDFSCQDGCSSTIDDDTIINLAQAMPGLKTLKLGKQPCRTVTGVTFKGLVVLASCCLQLTKLRVHFQAKSLAEATSRTDPPPSSEPTTVTPRRNCALTDLHVGKTPILGAKPLVLCLTLLQIFPEILNIEYVNPGWKNVVDTLKLSRQIEGHVDYASKGHLFYLKCSSVTLARQNLYREPSGKLTGVTVLTVFSYWQHM